MHKKITRNQALLTAIGCMIGSGIFFRADNILQSTNGELLIAVLSWIFISTTLVFAAISVSIVATDSNVDGGFIGYIEYYLTRIFNEKIAKNISFYIGWYQIVVYIPIMVSSISIVFGDYFIQLLGLNINSNYKYLFALILMLSMFIFNSYSTIIATMISVSATVVKLIPLMVISLFGIFFGDFDNFTPSNQVILNPITSVSLFFAPMLSMAFAYDGWISIGSLSREMNNPKKDLAFVYICSIIVTAIVYILYFTSISILMEPSKIIELGNSHVGVIAKQLFGSLGEKFVLVGVVISVLGATNGFFMVGTRYLHQLATKNLIKGSSFYVKQSKNGTLINSSLFILIASLVILLIYYMQSIYINLLNNNQNFFSMIIIDDIPMAINSMLYLIIFYFTIYLYRQKKTTLFKGLVSPIIAIIGQLFIVIAFFVVNEKNAWGYLFISALIVLIGFFFKKNRV